jgi:mono/diheme cytochrome c family protein
MLIAGTGWIVAAAIVATAATASAQSPFSGSQSPSTGARLFDEKGCARCHATAADDRTVKAGPNLARVAKTRTFFDLAAALWNHAPKMAATMRSQGLTRARLEPQEAGDLAAYLFTLDYFDRKGRPDAGKRLFAAKRCGDCHRVAGKGGDVGPALDTMKVIASPISVATAMWNHGPQMTAAMERAGVPRPTLSAAEIVDLIAYLHDVSPRPASRSVYVLPGHADQGLRVFTQARCVECHAIGGPSRPGIVDLVERAGRKSVTEFTAAMWNKAPAMQAAMKARNVEVPVLKPDDMADLVALLYSAQYFSRSGNPSRGVAVATNKRCFDCHGLHGERGKPASDLVTAKGLETPAGIVAALWNHSFIDDPRPTETRRMLARMSSGEMADLVAYLRSLRRTRP